ncbi:MAG: PLP-dependent aminotransferase family protein [Clostridia bacterium]|nr:PLP-dependent aminotransferase family protein [Clostridia bacterium]
MNYQFSDRLKNLEGNAIREIFKMLANPNIISFAGGFPTLQLLPTKEIDAIAHEILSSSQASAILQYGGTEGFYPLLESGLEYAKRTGLEGEIKNTLVISGGQQGIDLMFKAFLNKGDTILVENPTYLACLHILKTYECKAVGVNSDDDGLNLEDLECKIKLHNPKILYVVPNFSNPTGKTLPAEKRKAIAKLTAKYRVIVIEDDPYGEIRFAGERIPSIKSFDEDSNIVYITSFSKTISPGLRTGIAVADEKIIRKMTIGKQAVDVHTSNLSQAIIDKYLRKGLLEPHLKEIIPIYREKKEVMSAGIAKYMPSELKVTNPEGGLFIWGEFENGLNTSETFIEAVKEAETAYVCGTSFFASEDVHNTLRLNYSNATLEQIENGTKKLGDFFKKKISEMK